MMLIPGHPGPGLRGARWVASPARAGLGDISDRRPVVVGISGSEASRRALKAVVRAGGGELVLVCAAARRRTEAPTGLHDALKDDAYLLTGSAAVDEHLRTARELALWLGARSVVTRSEFGDPVTVLHDAAGDLGAGVVVGTSSGRPGRTARRLSRRLGRGVELVVTDGDRAHRRRFGAVRRDTRPVVPGVRWADAFALPQKGLASR
ncbi:universal stress protein [Gordonia aurantiaca]|uniref:universal stress protein n=1 Tax=Gordonia sp. B21 TaxID=3151852 RepID=UPI0032654BC5